MVEEVITPNDKASLMASLTMWFLPRSSALIIIETDICYFLTLIILRPLSIWLYIICFSALVHPIISIETKDDTQHTMEIATNERKPSGRIIIKNKGTTDATIVTISIFKITYFR